MMKEPSGKEVVRAFVSAIIKNKIAPKVLHITASTFGLFDDLPEAEITKVTRIEEIPDDVRFDINLGVMPFGMYVSTWKDKTNNQSVKSQLNWLWILESLTSLENQGDAVFLVEPHGLSTTQGQRFQGALNNRGYYVNGIFNTPEKLLPLCVNVTETPTAQ